MKLFKLVTSLSIFALVLASCSKKKEREDYSPRPPQQSHFNNADGATYYVENSPNSAYKVPISLTNPASSATKVKVTLVSPTNAVAGTQYTITSPLELTIPAGKANDSITVKGLFGGYATNRVDTLVFAITGGDVPAAAFNDTFKLVLRKYCPVSLTALSGDYDNTYDVEQPPVYGPYGVTITPTNAFSSGTVDTVRIDNFWDYGGYILVRLDWTDPANFKTTVLDGQTTLGYVHPTYGNVSVRSNGSSTFSSCDQTFDIKFNLFVSAGTFGNFRTTIAR